MELTRRSFVKGSVSAAAGMSLAGYAWLPANESMAQEDVDDIWTIQDLGDPAENLAAKLVIVGAGGTGVSAAIQAVQLGLDPQDLLVIEKQPFTGGSFIGTEGLFAVGSHWQLEAGETITAPEIIQKCMAYHHWVPDYELYRTFFDKTAQTVDWLESLGVEFDHVQPLGDSANCWHIYKGSNHPGVEFMASLTKAAEDLGISFVTDLGGKKLLLDAEGKIAGLLAVRSDGTVIQIDAPAVIVSTGGYANNTNMTGYLTGKPADFFNPAGTVGRDGDGIIMAYDAGASLTRFPGTLQVTGPVCRGSKWGDGVAATCLQPILWVNQNGKRYIGEDMSIKNFTFSGTAMMNQDRVFAICTQSQIDRFAEGDGIYVNVGVYALAGETLPDLKEQIEELRTAGTVFVADTIEELANQIGVDASQLVSTVDAYNSYCEAGLDPDFFKEPSMLIAMPQEEGPYYAFDCQDNYPTTCGGIKVNARCEVLSREGNIIPGLYVGGVDAGGFYGDAYDVGIAAGSTASWAINSGRIAAEQAVAYIGQ